MKAHARQVLSEHNVEHVITDVIEESAAVITQNDCSNYVTDMVLLIPSAANGQPLH